MSRRNPFISDAELRACRAEESGGRLQSFRRLNPQPSQFTRKLGDWHSVLRALDFEKPVAISTVAKKARLSRDRAQDVMDEMTTFGYAEEVAPTTGSTWRYRLTDEGGDEIRRRRNPDENPYGSFARGGTPRASGKLTAAMRHSLSSSDFAVPENEGLPIDTPGRTRAAMSRFNQYVFDSKAQAERAYKRITSRAKRLGIDWASSFDRALDQAKELAGGGKVLALTMPPFFYGTVGNGRA